MHSEIPSPRWFNVKRVIFGSCSWLNPDKLIFLFLFQDRFGLRWTAILGSSISCLGAWVKIFSVAPDRFYVTFIGQSLGASSQVLILSVPGHLAAYWFDAGELSTATSLGIFGTLVGVSAGFLITPIIVRNHENLDDIGEDLSRLYWYIAVITTVGFILVVLFFQDEPKLPPSKTRAIQKANRNDTKESFLRSMKRLITNKSYLLLCNSYGMNIGAFNVVATLLNQIYLTHFENGEKDAGRIGLAIVVMGMMGSVTFGVILDKTHRFKETAVTVYFLALCGQILFAVFLYLELKWMVYASAMFLGFFMSGYLSLGYELCAEYTYPEAEGVSTGFLNIANNVYGMVLVIILGKLMEVYGDVVVHAGLCTALLIGFVLTVLTKDEQRRQDARRAALYQSVPTKEADTARQNP
ncbi:feline leukemia virus subgroup C receptor-related protein 2 isoform X2 [Orussus abietinus]|uniref:feline leukemia virus subgroup C receptor-related protein 2 isoform X2 n=1 Tax=Orussus abietinus TaxID=222816 RepID=UPI000624F79A|nr:feline leukemia virus subgroup C receptor-related protein 2 isoform X2 [Orussus abietinus]